MLFKDLTKKMIKSTIGLEVYKSSSLPFGLDEFSDIKRTSSNFNPHTIFDVGANVGHQSLRYRSISKGNIYAFEPVTLTYDQLIVNVADHNIITHKLGLGDIEKTAQIYLQSAHGLNSITESLNYSTGLGSEYINITTLDSFCDTNSIGEISYLKIDTEGFGLKVLQGAKRMLSEGKIKWVFIEVGFSPNDKRHDYFPEVSEVLNHYSLRLFGFYNQWIQKRRLEYCNALFTLNL